VHEVVIFTSFYNMTCVPMVFVVIMIREINSKDEQGNDNIITNTLHSNHDVDDSN